MKKHPWLTFLTVLLVFVVWGVIAGALCASGYTKAKAGRDAINAARVHTDSAGLRDGTLEAQLNIAAADMKAAHSKLANPIVQPWRWFPFAGRQISSSIALTNAGYKVASVGANSLHQASALTNQAKTNRQATLASLGNIAGDANNQMARLNLGPRKGLLKPLAKARNELAVDLASVQQGLQRSAAGAEGASSLFNNKGNYLLFAANNAEMRSGSGMLLSAGILSTGGGKVTVGDMKDVNAYGVDNNSVTWPPEINQLWGFLKEKGQFQDLMLSPRFDVSAPLAQQMWKTSTGQSVDGVIVVDPDLLQAILKATGPVTVNGKQFTADNIQHFLLFEQYQNLSNTNTNAARRDVLSDVAKAAFNALDQGSWDPITLAKSLADAANGRHLLLYSNDAKINQDWITSGVSGTLDQNSLMLSLVNLGGNKLDQFMKLEANIDSTPNNVGFDYTVTVKVSSSAPTVGPQYVIGPFPNSKLKPGEYDGLLNFNVPGDASSVSFDGQQARFLQGPDGPTTAIAIRSDILASQSATYVLHFQRPKNTQFTHVMPGARIPASQWTADTGNWLDDHSHFTFP